MLNVLTVLEARMTVSENEVVKLKIESAGKLIISLLKSV